MFIQTEPTPNPVSVKFIPDAPFMIDGVVGPHAVFDFAVDDTAAYEKTGFFGPQRAPLPARLFQIPGVARVMVAPEYVVVTKTDDADWATLKSDILIAVMDHLASGSVAVNVPCTVAQTDGDRAAGDAGGDPALVSHIRAVIETYIRPGVASHGGDIALSHVADGVVYLHLRGACAGCPSLKITLKKGVETILKTHIPEIIGVEAVAA